ncbi:MAG: sensor histidine kinase [Alphaproteobacteria bacterium]
MNRIRIFFRNLFVFILPQRIWTRSLLILFLTLLAIEGMALYVFHDRHWRFVNYKLADNLASEVTFLYRELENDPKYLGRYNLHRNNLFDINIILGEEANFQNLKLLAKNKQRIRLERSLNKYLKKKYRLADYSSKEVAIGVASAKNNDIYYSFIVPRARVFDRSIALFLYWMVLGGVALSALAGCFLYFQVRPIVALAGLADGFGKGRNLDSLHSPTDIPLKGAREIRMVTRSFNQMMKRIYYQLKQRTTMLAGVSHDLRTPLTKLRLNLAFMVGDGKNKQTIKKMKDNLTDMERMIELYLQFAKGEDNEALSQVVVKDFIESIIHDWRGYIRKQKKHIDIFFKIDKSQMMLMRKDGMRRCLDNIIANGLKNAKRIVVTVRKETNAKNREAFIIFDIADNGKGIPLEEREKIFEAFYQMHDGHGDRNIRKASKKMKGGYGLGLAIARDIVLAHGGNITVDNVKGGGAIFSIAIPL